MPALQPKLRRCQRTVRRSRRLESVSRRRCWPTRRALADRAALAGEAEHQCDTMLRQALYLNIVAPKRLNSSNGSRELKTHSTREPFCFRKMILFALLGSLTWIHMPFFLSLYHVRDAAVLFVFSGSVLCTMNNFYRTVLNITLTGLGV